ncbi:50S ribosomal protein L25 [Ktedonospora formicarum]|uniref:Large ribosomal subunit protein bL25 n=1 Tax=Ktedonospora formicarum TaxID=2778364 RepID=A0A8J3I4G4_9CHLR|nr:50S ribosomal protein L25 [Ktedonospora formicarum]GHO44649.1 50S ribosomal protein L25 [Ktedonospora formicarum]
MAKPIEMDVTPREIMGKKTKSLRRQGLLPGNIGGHKLDSVAVQFDEKTFTRLQRESPVGSIYSLNLPKGKPETVLVRHVQHDPVSTQVLHVDFSRINLNEEVKIKIPLHFVGESLAIRDTKGTLLHMDALEVTCQASKIVPAIEVDIARLATLDDVIYAKDVELPKGYKLATEPEESVAKVAPPKVELPEPTEEAPVEAAPPAPAEGESGSTD